MAGKRKRGTGTLRKRKDGRWEARLVVGYNEKGNPVTKSVTAKFKKDCLEKLEKLKDECGVATGKSNPEMTFGEWIELWYNTYSKSSLRIKTQLQYEGMIKNHIIPSLGKILLNRLKQSDLQQFYATLKRNGRITKVELYGPGLSDRMVRSCHAICRTALDRAVKEGLIHINPAEGCKLPPKKAREMQILSNDEMQRFIIQTRENDFYEIALLELATGMRRGEICALQWDDLNFKTGELHIQRQAIHTNHMVVISKPKTKSSDRIVILPPSILNILKIHKERTKSKWIFPSPVKEGEPINPQSVYRKMRKILDRAECKPIRFHDLRHTFATTALEHGMDVKTLSTIIGHISSATTLDIYSHITDTMQIQAANTIDKTITKNEQSKQYNTPDKASDGEEKTSCKPKFKAKKGKIRKSGTGGIYMLNENLFEGRYTPTNAYGKREAHNVYAHTRKECEELLNKMIEEVRARIQAEKEALKF